MHNSQWWLVAQLQLVHQLFLFLQMFDLATVMQWSVTSHLDCIAMCTTWVSLWSVWKVQVVENAAVRLLTDTRPQQIKSPITTASLVSGWSTSRSNSKYLSWPIKPYMPWVQAITPYELQVFKILSGWRGGTSLDPRTFTGSLGRWKTEPLQQLLSGYGMHSPKKPNWHHFPHPSTCRRDILFLKAGLWLTRTSRGHYEVLYTELNEYILNAEQHDMLFSLILSHLGSPMSSKVA